MANNCYVRIDWSELSSDLLLLIVKNLPDLIDFISFRAVCKQWRSAISSSDYLHKIPWVMSLKSDRNDKINFCVFPSGKTISISSLPDHRKMYIRRSSNELPPDGKDENGLFSEGFEIRFTTPENNIEDVFTEREFRVTVDPLDSNLSGHEFVAHAPVGNLSKLSCCLLSKKKKALRIKFTSTRCSSYNIGNKLVSLHSNTPYIFVTDVPTGKEISEIPLPVDKYTRDPRLISTKDGLLIVIECAVPPQDDDVQYCYEHKFAVYRFESYDKEPYWTKLNGIGDMMLFLDYDNSFSLMANEYDGFRRNCIYFIKSVKERSAASLVTDVVAGFDMAEKRTFTVCSLGPRSTRNAFVWNFWFLPSLV